MASPKNTSTLTTAEVRALLRTAAEGLSAREEKVLRLRTGNSLAKSAPLPRRGQENADARAELAALEIELMLKFAPKPAPKAEPKPSAKTAAKPAAPTRSKEKEKIIRALRRLK